MTLKQRYESVATAYLNKFIEKQGFNHSFDGWIGGIGGIAGFAEQYFFNFDDIRYDIDNDCEVGLILRWQEDGVDHHMKGNTDTINYHSYHKGLRYEDLKK
jgi:hypothetical protein